MLDTHSPELLSITTLLGGQKYIIPLYQRNYTWKKHEIRQLLDDIYHMATQGDSSDYYIGTLVVSPNDNHDLEIIDGQQRFSTLTVVHAVLKAKEKKESALLDPVIGFEARDEVREYINVLYRDYDSARNFAKNNSEVSNFKSAVRYTEEFLKEIKDEVDVFSKYFYNKVKIIRLDVPLGTDINRYFEIMNNRGEQLEKHEILKAKFISNLPPNSPELRKRFADIWDACSQMDRHAVSSLEPELRKDICGDDYQQISREYLNENYFAANEGINSEVKSLLLKDILKQGPNIPEHQKRGFNETNANVGSIIDFPNFLLQILKLEFSDERLSNNIKTVSLDDKRLLIDFGYPDHLPNSIKFINSLLYYRLLFDRYVIKRIENTDKWSWSLLRPTISERSSSGKLYFVNTFGKDDSEVAEEEISYRHVIMLQSMFHVSFPGNNYKEWLQKWLGFLKGKSFSVEGSKLGDLQNASFLKVELMKMAQRRLQEVGDFYEFAGVDTPRFVFNFLDYLIWSTNGSLKVLDDVKENLSEARKKDFLELRKKKFGEFRFTQNSSVEHLHPQSRINELVPLDLPAFSDRQKILDYFGNLCLITRGSNSRYHNLDYDAKRSHFRDSSTVESLKQVLMFEYDKWTSVEIKEHGEAMIELLIQNKMVEVE